MADPYQVPPVQVPDSNMTPGTTTQPIDSNVSPQVPASMPVYKETIRGSFAGIQRTGFSGAGYSVGGFGRFMNPQNAIIITDQRILFIVLPGFSAGKIRAGINFDMINYLFREKGLTNKLNELISTTPIDNIVNQDDRNISISFQDLQGVHFGYSLLLSHHVIFNTTGNKLRYNVRDKASIGKLRELLANFIK